MRLVRPIAIAVAGVLVAGCSDAAAPPQWMNAAYILESIGGQPLPVTFPPSGGETVTVLSGSLHLNEFGGVGIVERRLTEFASSQEDRTITWVTDYERSDEAITVSSTCHGPSPSDCIPKRVGQLAGSTLTLSAELGGGPIYLYRLTGRF